MKDYDVVTDGKFVGVIKGNRIFYFGIYNHKYFSFYPPYWLSCYGSVSEIADFREVNDEEVDTFLEDLKKLGYIYEPDTVMFLNYPLNRKKDFMNLKLPKYIPFHSMSGHKVIDQFLDDQEEKMYWIFEDKSFTYLQTLHEASQGDTIQITSLEDQKYDHEDKWVGETLYSNMGGDGYIFNSLADTAPIIDHRQGWWKFAAACVKFPFFLNKTVDEFLAVFENKNYSILGSKLLEHDMIDEDEIFILCKEYFDNRRFYELREAILRKKTLEEEYKKTCKFDIL